MELTTEIHTTARRYLAERWHHWIDVDTGIPKSNEMQLRDSDAERDVIPRIAIVTAIVDEVERSVPSDFSDLEDARQRLSECASVVFDDWTVTNSIELAAIEDERRRYREFVLGLGNAELAETQPLPFRRRLSDEEIERWRVVLESTWGVMDWEWHPELDESRDDVEEYGDPSGWHRNDRIDIKVFEPIFAELAVGHYFELNRGGSTVRAHEIETLENNWDGDWGGTFYVPADASWLVHANYDYAIAVAGEALKLVLHRHQPDWEAFGSKP